MTTNQQQAQDEIAMLDHPGLKNAIADSLKKIGEHRQDFEQAMVDLQAIDKKIAEFDAQIAAKKSEADEVGNQIRTQLLHLLISPKEAFKLKAQRRAIYEEVEDLLWIAQETKKGRARVELRAIKAAGAYASTVDTAYCEADRYIESVLIETLSPETLMFIQIKKDVANRGLSTYYSADATCPTPMDFAVRELKRNIHIEFNNRPHSTVIGGFLPPHPESIRSYKRTPSAIHKIEAELAAMEVAQ